MGTATLFLAVVLLLLPSLTRAQQVATPKRILLLYWGDRDYAGNIVFDESFRRGLQSSPPETVEYYSEYLESDRFPGEKQSLLLRDYLRAKYAERNIDVILAVTDRPLAFLLRHRQELFTNIPIVFVAVQSPPAAELAAGPGITGIVYGGNQSSTLDLALRLHPGTEQIFIVSGTPEHDGRFEASARQDLEDLERRVSITYLTDLPLGELIARTSSLPEQSIILYLWQQSLDESGNVLESPDVIALIARSARVPIYGLANPVLGSGIVGGNLRSPEQMAARAADMALRIANGERASDIPVEPPLLAPMFDSRQLERWRISEGRLPQGSIVRYKEPTLWERYKWSIIGFTAFCFGQTVLIVGLLVQRSRRRRVERALAERELHLRESQAIAHVGSFHWDVSADKVTWSDEMCRIHGFEPGESGITYETYLDRVHPDHREGVRRTVEFSRLNQQPSEHEYRIVVNGSGEIRWVFTHAQPVIDSGGKLVALQGACQDITERKRTSELLRDSEIRNRAMLEAIPDMLFLLNRDGVYVDYYVQDPDMLLVPPDQFLGKNVRDVMPSAVAEQFAKCVEDVTRSGQIGLVEYSLPILGVERHYEARVVNCDGSRVLSLVREITEQKQAEQALRRSHDELEWRALQLRRLASDLTLAEQHVREDLAKTLHDGLQQLLFIAVMALDRAIAGNAQADQVALLQAARDEINEAMVVARTLSVNLFPPILHIGGLPSALAWLAKRTQEQYNVVVNVNANPRANPSTREVRILLFEAVREILFNAVKHAHVDRIDVSLDVEPDDTIHICVSDEGVGFDPVVILHHKSHQQGLGLFSIKERLALFGGHLDIQSAPGKGARFSLILPRTHLLRPASGGRSRDAGLQERLVHDSVDGMSKPLRILIADDHVVARAGLRELLSERPALQVVGEAANGVEAISQAVALQPAVIVMDVSMPHMNGIEATREIHGSMPHIQIVGLSTHDDENGERSMREAGAEAYFTKNEGADRLLNYLLSLQTRVKGAAPS
jgi:PAS domain S-box-containing protein